MEKEIAVRMFENKKLGTTYGKGKYRSAIFNASAELRDPHVKYLLDFYAIDRWQHTARTDAQIAIVNEVNAISQPNDLASWLVRYDPVHKTKTPVDGFAFLSMDSEKLVLIVNDAEFALSEEWVLQTRTCTVTHGKAPTLIATNTELAQW